MRLRPRSVTLLAALLAATLTDLVIMVPAAHFAYRSIPAHAMLETAATIIALLTTILLWGRLQQRQRLDDLLLFVALALLTTTNFLFAVIPAAIWTDPHPFSVWTTVSGGALAAALLAAAALAPSVRLRDYKKAARIAMILMAIGLVAMGTVVGLFVDQLPVGFDPARNPVKVAGLIVGNPFIAAVQLLIAVLFFVAAFGFTRRSERSGDELLLWLGASAMFAAFARVNYFIYPSLYSEWVYLGDALRLGWHALLFVGAAREIRLYQRAYAETRVLEERRRIARDLHDGLAQELAFIAATTRNLADGDTTSSRFRQLASAAERGLGESRRAIASLTSRGGDEPFDQALVQTVEEVADRLGARVVIDAEPTAGISPERQEQLLRIVREAVTNAARHSAASVVRVQFANGNGLRLRVEDNGIGFDPSAIQSSAGFGLVTMRERASAMGGEFHLMSAPDEGTRIEVIVP
jgi:signal transduction histidine kinase